MRPQRQNLRDSDGMIPVTFAKNLLCKETPVISHLLRPTSSTKGMVHHAAIAVAVVRALISRTQSAVGEPNVSGMQWRDSK